MSQAQKTLLRYNYVMEQTNYIQGDFSRTSGTWSNSVRTLAQSFETLGSIVGGVLINVLKPFVQALNQIMLKVIDFAQVISDALGKIFGWKYEVSGGGIADDFSAAADSAGDLSDLMDDTEDTAKKIQRDIMGFDIINKLSDQSDSSSTSGTSGTGTTGTTGTSTAGTWSQQESMLKEYESEIDNLYDLGAKISEKLQAAMESIVWDDIYEKARKFGTGLADFLNGLFSDKKLFEDLGDTIAGAVNTAITAADAFGEEFDFTQLGEDLGTALTNFLEGINWDEAIEAAGEWGKGVADTLNGFLKESDFELLGKTVADFIKAKVEAWYNFVTTFDFTQLGEKIADSINGFFDEMGKTDDDGMTGWEKMGKTITDSINGIVIAITTALEDVHWDEVGSAIIDFIEAIDFESIGINLAKLTNAIFKAVKDIVGDPEQWGTVGEKLASGINGYFSTADFASIGETVHNFIKAALTAAKELLEDTDFEQIGTKIGEFFKNMDLEDLTNDFAEVLWEAIKAAFEMLGNMFEEAPLETSLITAFAVLKFTGVGDKVSKQISKAIADKMASALGAAIGAASGIGTAISTAIGTHLTTALTAVKTFVTNFGTTFAGITAVIGGAVLAATNFVDMFVNGFSAIKEVLMVLGTAIAAVGAIILGIPASIAALVAAIVAAVATAVIVIKDNWDSIVQFFEEAIDKISGFFSDLWDGIVGVWDTASSWFKETVIDPIKEKFDKLCENIQKVFEGLWILVQAAWKVSSTWFSEHVTEPIKEKFSILKDKVSGFFTNLWSGIKSAWSSAANWFSNNVTSPIKSKFTSLKTNVSNIFSTLWSGIKNVWNGVSNWFKNNVITPVKDAFKTACNKIGDFFTSLWKGIKKGVASAFNAVISGIESAINGIVGGINGIIGGFNKIVTVAAKIVGADWSGVDTLSKVTLSRINVESYATGGFPEEGPFYMNRGEIAGKFSNGKGVVANNEQITEGIKNAVVEGMMEVFMATKDSQNNSGATPVVEFTFKTDSETLYKSVMKGKEKYNRRYNIAAEM